MDKIETGLMAAVLSLTLLALSAPAVEAQSHAPPGGDFQKVSELVELPEFIPGLGVPWVDPGGVRQHEWESRHMQKAAGESSGFYDRLCRIPPRGVEPLPPD